MVVADSFGHVKERMALCTIPEARSVATVPCKVLQPICTGTGASVMGRGKPWHSVTVIYAADPALHLIHDHGSARKHNEPLTECDIMPVPVHRRMQWACVSVKYSA